MHLIQLVYVSSATLPFSKTDLLELLAKSRINNAKADVTGLLLFKDGNFMQALEGEEQNVMPIYSKIAKDHRHSGILKLLGNSITGRDFPDWSMGFMDLRSSDLATYPGYSEFLNLSLTDRSIVTDQSKAHKLLSVFRNAMR